MNDGETGTCARLVVVMLLPSIGLRPWAGRLFHIFKVVKRRRSEGFFLLPRVIDFHIIFRYPSPPTLLQVTFKYSINNDFSTLSNRHP